jgi:hypothetical protein
MYGMAYFFAARRSIQNAKVQRTCVETVVYSGMGYTFPCLFNARWTFISHFETRLIISTNKVPRRAELTGEWRKQPRQETVACGTNIKMDLKEKFAKMLSTWTRSNDRFLWWGLYKNWELHGQLITNNCHTRFCNMELDC